MPFMTVAGRKIEYAKYGRDFPKSTTLVFLHDGLGCVSLWRDFPAKIAEAMQCGVFVYSRFGYGRSDPVTLPRPVRFMHDEALQILPEILEVAQIRHPILVGHSDGASIAIIYAASEFGKNVRGLILEAPHVFVEDLTVKSIFEAGEEYRNGSLRNRLEKYHGNNVDVAFWGWNGVWLNPDFRSWNIEECLPRIHQLLLIIQGEQDEFGTPLQVQSISTKSAGSVEIQMIPNCGHTPHREQPELTFNAMVNFIRTLL